MSITTILMVVQFLASLTIIVLVLLQQGKGADMGSSFGSGSAGSLFGATGAANFLSRTTKWAAVVFFASTIGLAYVTHAIKSSGGVVSSGVMQGVSTDAPKGDSVPVAPGAGKPAAPSAVPASPSVPSPTPSPAPSSTPTPSPAPASSPAPSSNGGADASVPNVPVTPTPPAK